MLDQTIKTSVYISSAKLQHGRITGIWVDLYKYHDFESFLKESIEALNKLGDQSPEILCLDSRNTSMFGLQTDCVCVNWIKKYFDLREQLDNDQIILIIALCQGNKKQGIDPRSVEDAIKMLDQYIGVFRDPEEYAETLIPEQTPHCIREYINLESLAFDTFINDAFYVKSPIDDEIFVFNRQ